MKTENVFERVEKKFLLTREQAEVLKADLDGFGFEKLDFGSPDISSVYWDSPDEILVRRSLERPVYKEKLRMRAYGTVQTDDMVYMEIKKKYRGVVYKRRVPIRLSDMAQVEKEGCMPDGCGQIGREITAMIRRYSLAPKTLIMYRREAYVLPGGEGIRLTMDTGIRYRRSILDVRCAQTGQLILSGDPVLLEVKIPGIWPQWLLRELEGLNVRGTHLSKVGLAYQLSRCTRKEEHASA